MLKILSTKPEAKTQSEGKNCPKSDNPWSWISKKLRGLKKSKWI